MRILVTLPAESPAIDQIHGYCWAHQQHGIHLCAGAHMVPDGAYLIWRIYCDSHNKYVDWLLLNHATSVRVY
jgi:hypothetical protein